MLFFFQLVDKYEMLEKDYALLKVSFIEMMPILKNAWKRVILVIL